MFYEYNDVRSDPELPLFAVMVENQAAGLRLGLQRESERKGSERRIVIEPLTAEQAQKELAGGTKFVEVK
jgi:hypothetical protein